MNALDSILSLSAQVSNALERTARPSIKDVKEARDFSKKCTKIADAAVALLEEGIYDVAERPEEGAPLFAPTGQPAAGVHVEEPEPPKVVQMALGCAVGTEGAIDVEVEPKHPLDVLAEDVLAQDAAFNALLTKLENAGLEEGLKLKAWKKAEQAWINAWNIAAETDGDELPALKEVYDLAVFALETRRPISWAIPTEKELNDHARKLAIASGE